MKMTLILYRSNIFLVLVVHHKLLLVLALYITYLSKIFLDKKFVLFKDIGFVDAIEKVFCNISKPLVAMSSG